MSKVVWLITDWAQKCTASGVVIKPITNTTVCWLFLWDKSVKIVKELNHMLLYNLIIYLIRPVCQYLLLFHRIKTFQNFFGSCCLCWVLGHDEFLLKRGAVHTTNLEKQLFDSITTRFIRNELSELQHTCFVKANGVSYLSTFSSYEGFEFVANF